LDREPDFGELDDEAGCLNVVIQLAFDTGEEHRDIELPSTRSSTSVVGKSPGTIGRRTTT
jgi:hypothetical protein